MATSLAQVFSEARSLVTKLHDREKGLDGMVSRAHSLNEKINCMKEYKEDLYELNDVAHQKPRTALVHNLQQENRQIRLLQEENRQLKLALEEHQSALELIMQRYRQQILKIMHLSKIQNLAEKASSSVTPKNDFPDNFSKMAFDFGRKFEDCLKLGEDASHRDQEEIARLYAENKLLRTLLKAAGMNDHRAEETFANLKDFIHAMDKVAHLDENINVKVSVEADENSTPTADRSPEEEEVAEASSSTAEEKAKTDAQEVAKSLVKVKAASIGSTSSTEKDSKISTEAVKKRPVKSGLGVKSQTHTGSTKARDHSLFCL